MGFGLWSDKEKEKTDAPAETAPAAPAGSGIKSVAGFSSLKDAQAAAPSSTIKEAPPGSAAKNPSGRKPSKKEEAADAEEARKKAAMEAAGKLMMKKFATIPYDTWAIFFSDEHYKLSDKEAQDLATEYFLLAQTMSFDFSKPWMLAIGILMLHGTLITERVHYMQEQEKAKEEAKKLASKKQPMPGNNLPA